MTSKPLADRVRPKTLDELTGQEHLTGEGAVIREAVIARRIPSMILWGPPGVGKTTLAQIIAGEMNVPYVGLSAIAAGVKEVREVIAMAKKAPPIILFIDEIHRFNKAQQDALLGAIEKGWIIFIGATTENPSFEVNSALLSRCQVYILKSLGEEQLKKVLDNALAKDEILKSKKIRIRDYEAMFRISGGDARKLLNILDLIATGTTGNEIEITDELVLKTVQANIALYDKSGEQHYDLISAFIKSMRGSDPNGAVYWMARMLKGGEDPKFIARRMIILASEDIGNANPTALILANNCFQAIDVIGMPEARIILAQTVVYLASSAKSNASYMAINNAFEAVEKHGDLPVPLHLRNAPTKLMKDIGYGREYLYAHDFQGNFVEEEFLPEQISGTKMYDPGNNQRELELRKRLASLWKDKYKY